MRLKFTCYSIEQNVNGCNVMLIPVKKASENKDIWNYVPSGRLELFTISEHVIKRLHVGTDYDIEITPTRG